MKKRTPSAIVISGDGINCERETAHALSLAGFDVEIRHLGDLLTERPSLEAIRERHDLIAFPGGFSFGDDLGSGRVLALKIRRGLGWDLREFVQAGGLVIGICNGFQALIRMGVFGETVSITHNAGGQFIDRWVELDVQKARSPWLQGMRALRLPIRHGEGRLVVAPRVRLKSPERQIALRYAEDCNGSLDQTAGLCDATGRILGLMPHPEAFVRATQAPDWTRGDPRRAQQEDGAGLRFFENAFRALSAQSRKLPRGRR